MKIKQLLSTLVVGASLAMTSSSFAATTVAVDPTLPDSLQNTVGQPITSEDDTLTLSNSDFGWNGPVTLSGTYSKEYGALLNAAYAKMLTEHDALGLLGDIGSGENRLDVTWARAWSDRQRTKLSAERLAQDMDFNYSSGTVSEWEPQYTLGVAYQYLLQQQRFHDLELSGYYSRSEDQTLSSKTYDDGGDDYLNNRHIAGATSKGLSLSTDATAWQHGLVGLGVNYDTVHYHNQYDLVDASDSDGFGWTLSLKQLLSKHIKLAVKASQRDIYDDYQATLSWLARAAASSSMELGLTAERNLNGDDGINDTRLGANVTYYIDDSRYQQGYQDDASDNTQSLLAWARVSAAYMDRVIAAADESNVLVVTSSSAPTPSVVTLKAGVVNNVNLSQTLSSQGVKTSGKTVSVYGGPEDVDFNYSDNEQLLVTEQAVPTSDVDKQFKPLVVDFTDDKGQTTDTLNFDVVVADSEELIDLNSGFDGNLEKNVGETFDSVYYITELAHPDDPSASNVMFDDNIEAFPALTIGSVKMNGSSVKSGQNHAVDGIYYTTGSIESQEFHIQGTPTAAADGMTIEVTACASLICSSTAQTINLSLDTVPTPTFSGGSLASAEGGVAYAGDNIAVVTSTSSATAPYVYTGDSKASITSLDDATFIDIDNGDKSYTPSSLGLSVALSGSGSKIKITSDGKFSSSSALTGHTLVLMVTVTNSDNVQATSSTSDFQLQVASPPIFNDTSSDLGSINPEQAYTSSSPFYTFDVDPGTSDLSSVSAAYSISGASSGKCSSSNTGLLVGLDGDLSPVLYTTSGVNIDCEGATIAIDATVSNTQGLSATDSFSVDVNTLASPTVAAGSLSAATQGQTYSGDSIAVVDDTSGAAAPYIYTGGDGVTISSLDSASFVDVDNGNKSYTPAKLGLSVSLSDAGDSIDIAADGTFSDASAIAGHDLALLVTVTNSNGKSVTSSDSDFMLEVTGNPSFDDSSTNLGHIDPSTAYTSSSPFYTFNVDSGGSELASASAIYSVANPANNGCTASTTGLTMGLDSSNEAVLYTDKVGVSNDCEGATITVHASVTNEDGLSASQDFTVGVNDDTPSFGAGSLISVTEGDEYAGDDIAIVSNTSGATAPYIYTGASTVSIASLDSAVFKDTSTGTSYTPSEIGLSVSLASNGNKVKVRSDGSFTENKSLADHDLALIIEVTNSLGESATSTSSDFILSVNAGDGSAVVLSCPTTDQVFGSSKGDTVTVDGVKFTLTKANDSGIKNASWLTLRSASLDGDQYTCNYNASTNYQLTSINYTAVATLPVDDATVTGSDWQSNSYCAIGTDGSSSDSCQVTYTE